MMEPWLVTALIFGSLIVLLALGLPIAFVLGGVAIAFILLLQGPAGLYVVYSMAFSEGSSYILVAAPLFVLMANTLEVSGIADDLYTLMERWFARLPGGLATGTVVICAIFAAMSGISAVATITMGVIAIPAMLKRGYDRKLAIGTVAAGGALGILIPPSLIAIIYGQLTEASVGKLFMAGLFPGILLTVFYIIYITTRSFLQPALARPIPKEERANWRQKFAALRALVLPFALILLVLGSIYTGICTPTEAAGVGAFGSIICIIIYRRLNWKNAKEIMSRTLKLTCMVLWIVIGASAFTSIYIREGASEFVTTLIVGWQLHPMLVIGIMMVIYLILGCFIDPAGMCMITIPVFAPIVQALGFDLVWFGILFIMNCEMAYLTPPFGFNLFYLRAILPRSVPMSEIYRSVVPWVIIQAVGLVVVMFVPQIALWLPNMMIAK